ncbi:MAG: serine/threonine-protein kinase [Leptolyngbyaceae cyanobacterium MO_188.B28]|nr:serine/threonine-protein kinase [Leptolyngbyaceae cyanobacterium MO_188.B28]
MSKYPDFGCHHYQVRRELGKNHAGGRVTYLAIHTKTQQPVVIKQFEFARSGSGWKNHSAYERELQVLEILNHPSIPHYLNSFETPTGFSIVQEYKKAASLAQPRHFRPEEIKQIAVAILKVLVYLQSQNPPIIHRDIKPENVLVDRSKRLRAYLVDFGFAHLCHRDVAVSSVVKGTLGFMPPEQVYNRQLTEASDLYSLGATLICLLTKRKSTEVGELIDESGRINLHSLPLDLNPKFVDWLAKMTAPNVKDRYDDAAEALSVLRPLEIVGRAQPLVKVFRSLRSQHKTLAAGGFITVGGVALLSLIGFMPKGGETVEAAMCGKLKKTKVAEQAIEHLLATGKCIRCDLTGANLAGLNLKRVNLAGARLVDVQMERTDLEDANLECAELSGNLRQIDLEGANLEWASLAWSDLQKADLRNTNLNEADLKASNLEGVNFEGANLENANLENVILNGAQLQGANLENADLDQALMWGVKLEGSQLATVQRLEGIQLGEVNLDGLNLQEIDLEGANLNRSSLREADLADANLKAISLMNSNLENANLENANLENANLTNTDFEGSNLQGATLKGAKSEGINLRGATLCNTTMPDGTVVNQDC